MSREPSGEEGVRSGACRHSIDVAVPWYPRVPLASLAQSRRSDSHSLAEIFFNLAGSLFAGYPLNRTKLILLLFISGNFSQKSNKNSSNHMLDTNYVSTRSYVRHQGLLLPAGWLALKLVSHHLETPNTFENTKVLTLLYKNIHKSIFSLNLKSADNNGRLFS